MMTYQLITSRSDLGGNDHVDWAALGPSKTPIVTPRQGQTADGAWYVLTQPKHLVRLRQGTDAAATWVGNFAQDDAVLATSLDPSPIEIRFTPPVRGAGAQVQPADLPGNAGKKFRARIVAQDAGGNVLAQFDLDGRSTNGNDDQAIFIGILSDQPGIVSLEINAAWLDQPNQVVDLGINRLDVRD